MPNDALREKVEIALERLSAENRRARQTGTVKDRYRYDGGVFRLSHQFAQHSRAEIIARMLGHKSEDDTADASWFIKRVLRRTSEDDRRLRSKHASALIYAAVRDVAVEDVTGFIQEKGGFNACARRLRIRRRKGLC
jgi:hypothetical protein